jgi:uncharacterized membrane protein
MARTPRIPVSRPAIVGAFATRPRLAGSLLTGIGAGLAVGAFTQFRPMAAVLIGWDVACLTFVGLMMRYMWKRDQKTLRTHAAEADEGRIVVLVLIVAASVASVAAIVMELSAAKSDHGLVRALSLCLAFFTVVMSWWFVQLNFALHYAHAYYTRSQSGRGDAGGLNFPGNEAPDYWDFLHFSIIIGVAAQTADIAFTEKGLRRLGTAHSLFAFVFNTVIVALTINLLASLF